MLQAHTTSVKPAPSPTPINSPPPQAERTITGLAHLSALGKSFPTFWRHRVRFRFGLDNRLLFAQPKQTGPALETRQTTNKHQSVPLILLGIHHPSQTPFSSLFSILYCFYFLLLGPPPSCFLFTASSSPLSGTCPALYRVCSSCS